jgi:hypothetical protein
VKNTTTSTLILVFLIGASIGYFGSSIYENLTSQLIFIHLNTALAILLLDIAILFWGINFRNRLLGKYRQIPVAPLVAARTTALALAASRTGAVLTGFYLAVAIFFIPSMANQTSSQRLTNALISAFVAIWLMFLGVWLEQICRIKQPNDDDGQYY